jgi:hypothetical protein
VDKPRPRKNLQSDPVLCASKVKIMRSKFITVAEVMEIVNSSDFVVFEIEDPNECDDDTSRNHSSGRYLSVEQEIVLEPWPQRGQNGKCQAPMDVD